MTTYEGELINITEIEGLIAFEYKSLSNITLESTKSFYNDSVNKNQIRFETY